MDTQTIRNLRQSLAQQHRSAKSILTYRKAQRKEDAMAFAELIYDVFKEKKRKENDKIEEVQNNAQSNSTN